MKQVTLSTRAGHDLGQVESTDIIPHQTCAATKLRVPRHGESGDRYLRRQRSFESRRKNKKSHLAGKRHALLPRPLPRSRRPPRRCHRWASSYRCCQHSTPTLPQRQPGSAAPECEPSWARVGSPCLCLAEGFVRNTGPACEKNGCWPAGRRRGGCCARDSSFWLGVRVFQAWRSSTEG